VPRSRITDTAAYVTSSSIIGAGGHTVLEAAKADVGRTREDVRQTRLTRLFVLFLGPLGGYMWYRLLSGNPMRIGLPNISAQTWIMILFFGGIMAMSFGQWYYGGKSPHVLYSPSQISTRMEDVKGIGPLQDEVVRSLNLFLAHKTFQADMGGTARRGLLFEGPPGTGKTMMAKAMAREAGVPFLFVSATAFQSGFMGGGVRRVRNYFKKLRKLARRNGGAIGFIEEIDGAGSRRAGVSGMTASNAVGHFDSCMADLSIADARRSGVRTEQATTTGGQTEGFVNEMLVQMQSFDELTGWQIFAGSCIEFVNAWLPASRQFRKPTPKPVNVLVIAATNRADNLDPALLRPGRFDRKLSFDLPSRAGRREIIDYYLAKKSHTPELDDEEARNGLAAITQGYSPVMIEHLLDEALVNALRAGRMAMDREDIESARLTEEIGLGQPVAYTDYEKRLIATHEAGHATVAYLVAPDRRLEVLSIIKRKSALGLLAHGDIDEVWTRSRNELMNFIRISMGGQCAEELFFGDVSNGPSGDLMTATKVAAEMVGAAGMSDTLVSFAAMHEGGFGDANLVSRVLGDKDGRKMVEGLLNDMKAEALQLLDQNRHLVEALRDALMERNELVGPQILDVLRSADARPTTIDLRTPDEIAVADQQ
jgi:cell division protease FtsH